MLRVVDLGSINPATLKRNKNNAILFQYLQKHQSRKLFKKNIKRKVTTGNTTYKCKQTNSLLRRKRASAAEEERVSPVFYEMDYHWS